MATPAPYDTLYSFKDIHKVVLQLADDLNDEQLNGKLEGYSPSIGFHLWHLAREMECLKGMQTPHVSIHPFAKRAGQTGFGSATENRK